MGRITVYPKHGSAPSTSQVAPGSDETIHSTAAKLADRLIKAGQDVRFVIEYDGGQKVAYSAKETLALGYLYGEERA